MKAQNFEPYEEVIANSIESCLTPDQLHCCWDMIERFIEVFTPLVDAEKVSKSANQLMFKYGDKQSLLSL